MFTGSRKAEAVPGESPRALKVRQEAQAVAGWLGVRPLLGADATREALLGVRRPRMLHLATTVSSVAPPSADRVGAWANPLARVVVALAGTDTLTAEEATALDVAGSGIVLSVRSAGPEGTGTGVLGRALRLAGARWVVTSLWSAPPAARLVFLESFYRRILNGSAAAEAVREAQLAVRQRYPGMLCWAGWTCNG
jgi:CHAT domain-containing protein